MLRLRGIKSQGGIVHYKSLAFILFYLFDLYVRYLHGEMSQSQVKQLGLVQRHTSPVTIMLIVHT